MFFEPYLEGMGVEMPDSELFSGDFWLGMEQSFYILDYNTKEPVPRRRAKSLARHLNRKVWEPLLTGKASYGWRLLNSVIKEEPGALQYEFNLPFPIFFGNFEAVHRVLDVALGALHEEANNRGVLISTLPVETEQGTFLTDNHITMSHLDIPTISAYNNLRANIPELLVPSSNSPITDSGKSERNILLDDLYPYPHVGPRISNYKQYENYIGQQRPDMDKLIVVRRKLSESERKSQKNYADVLEEAAIWSYLKNKTETLHMVDYPIVSEDVSTPLPKPADVHIKDISAEYRSPRIEVLLPDGSTCADDIVLNMAMTMMAAYTPKSSGLSPTLDMYLLQGRKTYASLTGEVYDVENPSEVEGVWNGMGRARRDYIMRDPLALFFFFMDKGLLFKVNDYSLYSGKLDEWRVPQRIRERIKNLKVGESPANTYERTDEPVYRAFDNLNENVSWIKR
jgi:hypothetical protein